MPLSPVAAIIVNFRTMELTVAAAKSVLSEPEVAELLVVDNASGDGSVEFLRDQLTDSRARILANGANDGFGSAVNLGATKTSAPHLLILNSDAALRPAAIGRLVADLETDERLGVVAPLVLGPDGLSPQADAFGAFPSWRVMVTRTNRRPRDEVDPDWVSGVAFLARRRALDDVGWFDPGFRMYLEDVDLCRRLRGRGWGIRRDTSVAVVHLGGASRHSNRDQDESYHRSLMRYMRRAGHPRWQMWPMELLHPLWQAARRWLAAPGGPPARR